MVTTSPRAALALGAALAIGVLGAANLAGLGQSSALAAQELDRPAIEKIVREYLLENPEVIFEAAERYGEKRQAEAQALAQDEIRANLPTLMSGAAGHAIGADPQAADVLVVEFFDYHCGFCKRATEFVFDLAGDNPDVRVVFQELPVVHQKSREVALASLAVAGTADFEPLHRGMMGASGILEEPQILAIAKKAGIDHATLKDALRDGTPRRALLEETLDLSMQIATAIGVDGTPGFIVASADGTYVQLVAGFNAAAVQAAIDQARRS